MKMKWTIVGILAVLLIGVFALGGCVTQGPTGPQGPQGEPGDCASCPECDCAGGGGTAQLFFWADGCLAPTDEVYVVGSGFKADATVTLYFATDGDDQSLKWFKIKTNEVGAFAVTANLPGGDEFNLDIFKDVSVSDDTPCGDGYIALTVNAFVGSSIVTTYPMLIEAP